MSSHLLLETGDLILLEDGSGSLLLESSTTDTGAMAIALALAESWNRILPLVLPTPLS